MLLGTLNNEQKELFLHLAHSVVVSDGELNTGEAVLMAQMRREMGLPDALEPHYVQVAGTEKVFNTSRAQTICMIELLRLAYSDGAFETEEQGFLGLLSEQFAIDSETFRRIDHWVRRLIALEEAVKDLY